MFVSVQGSLIIPSGGLPVLNPPLSLAGNTGGNAADAAYMRHLADLAYSVLGGKSAVQLYTTDGGDAGGCSGSVVRS